MHDVFVSRPSTRNNKQEEFICLFDKKLDDRNLRPRILGQTDYSNTTPMQAVRDLMEECEGAIILGLEQLYVKEGIQVPGSSEEKEIKDLHHATPWNQIEAGMTFMLDIPLLIIRERDVTGGVFELGSVNRYIHEATLTKEWIDPKEFIDPFNEWYENVVQQ